MRSRLALAIASCGYIGFAPPAPGTFGTVAGCLLLYAFPFLGHPLTVVSAVAVALLSVRALGLMQREDPSYVVIDEFAGILIALVGHPATVPELLKGFILFRAFDILKPYPIKKIERLPGAWGIVADDVTAGIFTNIVLMVLGRIW